MMRRLLLMRVGFDEALEMVLGHAADLPTAESGSPLLACGGRVLAEAVMADRDQPPFDRSTRDGFAVRLGVWRLEAIEDGGAGAGGRAVAGQGAADRSAIEIMTGAPVPEGADAVVMVEHVERVGGAIRLAGRPDGSSWGEYCSARKRGRDGRSGAAAGTVMEGAEIALAAACGRAS